MSLTLCRPKLVPENTKIEQREKGREAKALKAAQLEKAIEKELLERLKQADEDQIVNYPEVNYNKVLSKAAAKFKEKGGKTEQLEDPDELAEDEEYEREVEAEEEENMSELQLEGAEYDDDEEAEDYNIQYVEVGLSSLPSSALLLKSLVLTTFTGFRRER